MFRIIFATAIAAGTSAAFAQNSRTAQKGSAVSSSQQTAVKELAPGGTLRVGINFGNMVLAQGTPDAPRGITPDLARELGKRLGVPIEFIPFDAAGKTFAALKAGKLDIVFLAIEPVRAAEVEFTPPYVLIEGIYLVAKDSPLQTIADVDRDGLRIAANQDSAYDLFLTRTLKHANLARAGYAARASLQDKLQRGARAQ